MNVGSALANAGTPMIWGNLLMLVVGNWLIALIEARILFKRYGVPLSFSQDPLIFANYLTAIVGFLPWWLIDGQRLAAAVEGIEIPFSIAAYVAAYGVTVAIESLVVGRVARKAGREVPAIRAGLLMNAATYMLMLPFALLVSN